MIRAILSIVAIGLLLVSAPLAAIELSVDPEVPVEGQPAQITVSFNGAPVAGAAVKARRSRLAVCGSLTAGSA